MRKRIIDAIFDGWCEGEFGMKTDEGPARCEAITNIAEHFEASIDDSIFIEEQINEAICEKEKITFRDAFYLCLELLNGNVFKGGYHETGSQDCCENE
ncbi:hypothetical protein NXH76_20515 [Blautia schinkii]|nr:hypothetical protein [Blautia schinkii]